MPGAELTVLLVQCLAQVPSLTQTLQLYLKKGVTKQQGKCYRITRLFLLDACAGQTGGLLAELEWQRLLTGLNSAAVGSLVGNGPFARLVGWEWDDAEKGAKGEYPRGCEPAWRNTGGREGSSESRGWWIARGEQESCPALPGMVLVCLINSTPSRKERNDEMKKTSASFAERALRGQHCFMVQTTWLIGFPNNISQCLSVRGPWEQ